MAVAYVASAIIMASSGGSSTVSTAISSGAGSNRLLLGLTRPWSNSVTSGSYNGAALTSAGTFGSLKMWKKVAPTTGSNTVSFTTSSTYTQVSVSIATFSGVDQATPLGTASSASGSSATAATASITCPSGGAIYAGEYTGYAVAAFTPTIASGTLAGAGQTLGQTMAGGYRTTTGTISWSIRSAPWDVYGFPINVAATPANPRYGDMNFMGI